jgi:lipopolysaccharide export system permease protein
VLAALLEQPGHFYELFPIAVLIGTIYAMARLAQSSEFTILRTGGLGPGRALGCWLTLGLVFARLTFVVGDYVAPYTEQQATALKAAFAAATLGSTGAWLKERRAPARRPTPASAACRSTCGAGADGALLGVRIFEFDTDGRLRTRIEGHQRPGLADGTWRRRREVTHRLATPEHQRRPPSRCASSAAGRRSTGPAARRRRGGRGAAAAVKNMSTVDLWRYSRHLADQEQAAAAHEIQFWKKALYPLACIVMVALALPFAYLHARAGGVSLKVFGGIMLGISFVLLNNAVPATWACCATGHPGWPLPPPAACTC